MEKMSKFRECGTHEKRRDNDELQRLCESCSRNFFLCEMCRSVKNIDVPLSICMKCAPAMKTLKVILERKDNAIQELTDKLKKTENDNKGFHEMNDSLRKQFGALRRQSEENRVNLKMYKDEFITLKKSHEELKKNYERLTLETKPKDRFLKDMKKLLENKEFQDLSINVGNEVYSAHKCILAARSEKLKKLLEPVIDPNDKKHQRKLEVNNLQFTDVSEDAMPIFMSYIYTGNIDKKINHNNVGEIIKLADKFEMNELRDIALNYMQQQIDRSTVLPILVQASHYNNEILKNKCIEFINREAIDLIDSPQWEAIKRDNPSAALDVYEARMKSYDSSSSTKDGNNNKLQYASMHNIDDYKSPRKQETFRSLNRTDSRSIKNLENI